MFHRRKILLSLLEASGGSLSNTDMQKLLFLYCNQTGHNDYDFFPYKFGCFSFVSYQDKRVLEKQGYLKRGDGFTLNGRRSMLGQLDISERQTIEGFSREMKKLRGKALIRHVYLKFPYYAYRSEIKEKVLSSKERSRVKHAFHPKTNPRLMTLGYEGRTIDAYINTLIEHNIALVVDVRRNPISMKYGFSKTRLRYYLSRVGIAYEHIPQLGIDSALRRDLETEQDYRKLFKQYAAILPQRVTELQRIHELLIQRKRVALTCFEAHAISCHRHKITQLLEKRIGWKIPIVHLE